MHGKHTRSTAADQPALLPDYKVAWLWGGGGGGGHGKPTRSTAADQPALLPDYKTTWFWEKVFGGFAGGMISTCAQLLQTSQLVFRNTKSADPLPPRGRRWGSVRLALEGDCGRALGTDSFLLSI